MSTQPKQTNNKAKHFRLIVVSRSQTESTIQNTYNRIFGNQILQGVSKHLSSHFEK